MTLSEKLLIIGSENAAVVEQIIDRVITIGDTKTVDLDSSQLQRQVLDEARTVVDRRTLQILEGYFSGSSEE